jgi:ferredoxin
VSPATLERPAHAWQALEHGFDRAFGSALNPLKHLGALAFLMCWLLAASGIVLYVVLDTSAAGAYASIDALAAVPLGLGTALRGLHRYAADAFVLLTVLHLAREAVFGRFRHFRKFSWLTGAAVLPLVAVCAIGGFWLNWDRLGQFSAVATAEWLDALPLFASPLARNFLGGAVSDRLFSLFVFVHLGVPLLLMFGLWFHVQRTSRAEIFPKRALAAGTVAALLVLAYAAPVESQGPADLATAPGSLRLDWLLLFLHPLAHALSAEAAWAIVLGGFALLLALPWWPGTRQAPTAVVDPAHCNGCGRCVEDCPYAAITLVPHASGRAGLRMAQVRAASCASCGICAGACPSSTPFRRAEPLVSGIELPALPIDAWRARLEQGLAGLPEGGRIVVFGCACGAPAPRERGVLSLAMPCAAMLPPSFVEYALDHGADAVLVASCREGGCEYRLGPQWVHERLHGRREPRLRAAVPAHRCAHVQADRGELLRVRQALAQLRGGTA